MATLITSQTFLDDEIVAAKVAAEDFEVTVSPVFEIDGVEYQVILDGHHSHAAAKVAGVEPVITVATVMTDDRVALLDEGHTDLFLEAAWMDGEYRDANTGIYAW